MFIQILLVVLCMSGFSVLAQSEPQHRAFRDCDDCPEIGIIPSGSFEMGSESGYSDEKLVHKITINYAFALGKTEVTQAQ